MNVLFCRGPGDVLYSERVRWCRVMGRPSCRLVTGSGQLRIPVRRTAVLTESRCATRLWQRAGCWFVLAPAGRVVLFHHAGGDAPARPRPRLYRPGLPVLGPGLSYWTWPQRWKDEAMRVKRFRVQVTADPRGHAVVAVPFDPDKAWGVKAVHHVTGTVNGCRVRVTLAPGDSGWAFTLNPLRMRGTGAEVGPRRPLSWRRRARSGAILPMTSPRRWRPRLPRGLFRHAGAVLPQGLPAIHRRDDPPAGPPRGAHR